MKKFEPQRTAKYYYLRLLRLKGDPQSLARGVAIGTFIGITPTIPFHTMLIIAATVFIRSSAIAGLLVSVLVSNPLTFFFQYYFSWKIGSWLLRSDFCWEKIERTMKILLSDAGFQASVEALGRLSQDAILVMLVGGTILALPFTFAAYFLSMQFFTAVQKKRQAKKAKQAEQAGQAKD